MNAELNAALNKLAALYKNKSRKEVEADSDFVQYSAAIKRGILSILFPEPVVAELSKNGNGNGNGHSPVAPKVEQAEPKTETMPTETLTREENAQEDEDGYCDVQPLTEQDAIELVTRWAASDRKFPVNERASHESIFERLKEGPCAVPDSKLREIVSTYAAPVATAATTAKESTAKELTTTKESVPTYPAELEPLVQSGVAKFQGGIWLVNRCYGCGQFRSKCCGEIKAVGAVRSDGQTFTLFGRQAVGLDPIRPVAPALSEKQIIEKRITDIQNEACWNEFRGVGELEGDGTLKMHIENFLPEGITLLCGLYKEGKSFLAMSIAKALTTGKPLWEQPGFEVPETIPVVYLAAESGDSELKMRCKKFGITEDKTKFMTRTLSKGPMLGLNDPSLESLVKVMKPAIVIETLIRFTEGDEDDASDNRQLAHQIFRLIGWGARAVIVIHHSIKAINKSNPTKSEASRGSGDILAMADVIWLTMMDDSLYNGKGVNEVDVVGWGRDFNPIPVRLALTGKAENFPPSTKQYAPGVVSYLDTEGNFHWVDKVAQQAKKIELGQRLELLIAGNPTLSLGDLAKETGHTVWEVRKAVKKLGYHRPTGGKKGESKWVKTK